MATGASGPPTPPILVWETGDLYVFESVQETEKSLEAIDVKDGIYRAFDSKGSLLRLDVRSERGKILSLIPVVRDRVIVSVAEEGSSHEKELAEILTSFLVATGGTREVIGRMSLGELIENARRVNATRRRWGGPRTRL